ncbi:MAG TPA: HAMP domain-containing sensor histidine kinase [Candidatus Binataceae bacterium]|nr:HAMP domain-containing sensor histidine kinase [Candidatus Binataceae bacterium]
MPLADFISTNKELVIERWKAAATHRLGLALETSELVNHLPFFLDDLVEALRSPAGQWPDMSGARQHGRQRMRRGIDIGALSEEMTLIGEIVLELMSQVEIPVLTDEVGELFHVMGRGVAASVRAYAALRDREIVEQATQHYSFIAHEIRGPLQAARLTVALLRNEQAHKREKHLERLDRAIVRVSQLVDDSIIDARLSGNPRINAQPVAVLELVNTICAESAEQCEAKNIAVVEEVEDLQVDADQKLLASAITNLMGNAIKFSSEGSRVTIRARALEDRVLFEVEDSCGGLPDDLPPKLFQPFVQDAADRSGFGLGLSIVKRAVEAHHGSVRVSNRPHEGCTFVLDLPLRFANPDEEGSSK